MLKRISKEYGKNGLVFLFEDEYTRSWLCKSTGSIQGMDWEWNGFLKNTLYRLVEAFFEANPDILLYICETGDDKQRFRNRLFVRWFNNYSRRDEFVLKTAEVLDESVVNFAAMIVQRSHPRLNVILNDFDETIALLQK